jgi:hypothetical protein
MTTNSTTNNASSNNITTSKGETRSIAMVARNFVFQLIKDLWGYDVAFQQKVVEKIFGHELMKLMLPNYLKSMVDTKDNHIIVQSIKFGVAIHLANGKTFKQVATKELLGTLASTKRATSRKVTKQLGFDRRCIYQSFQRHLLIDDGQDKKITTI